jgi:hypothetical protein
VSLSQAFKQAEQLGLFGRITQKENWGFVKVCHNFCEI